MRGAIDPTARVSTGDPSVWQPPTPEDLQARLGGAYLIESFLARGGMGAVYRGIQVSLERVVAIKILPPQVCELDPSFAQRFKQEAKAMARLNHPSIISVYDFGEMEDGTLYFVMEFIEGKDVAQMVTRQGRLSSKQAMAITAHVCDALQYAHENGVVHRDIKPANIMVSNDGRVKVADFGLAKSSRVALTSLTMSGHVMGTPHFLAPEALTLGSSVDHRADIYAVGVMLYQMLTGRLPQGIFEMPSMLVAGLDPRYDQIIANAMREDRSARYQAILNMRQALDAILTKPVAKSQAAPQQKPAAEPALQQQRVQAAPPKAQASEHYYRPPQTAAPPPRRVKEKSNTTTWLLAGVLLLALGGIAWNVSAVRPGGVADNQGQGLHRELDMNSEAATGDTSLNSVGPSTAQPTAELAMNAPDASISSPAAPISDLVFPTVQFRGATIPEVIEYFQIKSRDIDPTKKGVTFLANETVRTRPARINMDLKNITLFELIEIFARQARLDAELSDSNVMLHTSQANPSPFPIGVPSSRLQQQGKAILPSMVFNEATVEEAAEYIRSKGAEVSGQHVNLVVDPAISMRDRKITLHSTFVSMSNAIAYIADLCDGEVAYIHDTFYLQPASKEPTKTNSTEIVEFSEAGKFTLPSLTFRGATLSEAIEFLILKSPALDPQHKGTDIEILVDDITRKSAGKITLDARNITIADAIYQIALIAGLDRCRVGDAVRLRAPISAQKSISAPMLDLPKPVTHAAPAPNKPASEFRTFTNSKGQSIIASLVKISGDDIVLRKDDGTDYTVKAATLSAADIAYLKTKGLVLPTTPDVAVSVPPASPKTTETPTPSGRGSTTYGGMAFSPNWLPQTLTAKRELLESLDFYCKAAVGDAPRGMEAIPGAIVGSIGWRMPIDAAVQTLPRGFNKLAERPMVHPCLPNDSLTLCGFQFKSFTDHEQPFNQLFMLVDKERKVVSVQFVDQLGKNARWLPVPDGIREPYYNLVSLTHNGSTGKEVPYQILSGGSSAVCIKTAFQDRSMRIPNMPNLPPNMVSPQVMPSGSRIHENVHWYVPAPFARSILDIVEVYRRAGVIK